MQMKPGGNVNGVHILNNVVNVLIWMIGGNDFDAYDSFARDRQREGAYYNSWSDQKEIVNHRSHLE